MSDRPRRTSIIGKDIIIESKIPSEISEVTRRVEFISSAETPIFSKKDVGNKIRELVQEEGWSSQDIEYIQNDLDEFGNLVSLSVVIKPEAADKKGYAEIVYRFMAQGDHGEDGGGIKNTSIYRFTSPTDRPGDFSDIRIILSYDVQNKVWIRMKN